MPLVSVCRICAVICFFVLLGNTNGYSQVDTIVLTNPVPDSLSESSGKKQKGSSIFSGRPGKSLLFSLIIPGAGQIYNKSYLRVPFVWAAVGGMGYVMVNTQRQYNCFREAYVDKIDGRTVTLEKYCSNKDGYVPFTTISPERLNNSEAATIRRYRDQSNVYRQWAIVGFTVVWLANGVDAFVDAHLKDFDIDEDLSIDIGPKIDNDPFAPMRVGIFVTLK